MAWSSRGKFWGRLSDIVEYQVEFAHDFPGELFRSSHLSFSSALAFLLGLENSGLIGHVDVTRVVAGAGAAVVVGVCREGAR